MDKYEQLFDEIYKQTKDGALKWEIEHSDSFEKFVFQSGFIASLYSSEFSKNDKKYTVLFAEKHMPHMGGDWDGLAQDYYPELYFLTRKGIAFVLDQRYVEIEELSKLGELIRENNEESKSLFE